MTVRIVAAAERELREAIDQYNEQRPGLGFEFAVAVRLAFDRIVDFPEAWPAFSRRTRRCLVGGFPYGVLYQHAGADTLVLAIMHLRRAPVRWKDRIRDA